MKVKELQEELQDTEIEAVAAEGGVTVVISGAQVPLSVTVTEELLSKGSSAVSEAVSQAAKEAHTSSMEYAKQRMTDLYSYARAPSLPFLSPAPRLGICRVSRGKNGARAAFRRRVACAQH